MKKIFIAILMCGIVVTTWATSHGKKILSSETKKYSDEGNKIKLVLGTKTFDLTSYNLNYFPTESEKSNSPYQSTNFTVGIKSSKIDQELLDWIFAENQEPKTAEITVTDGDTGKIIKSLSFTGVRTNNFSENYNSNNGYINQYVNLSFRYKTVRIKLKQ